VIRWPAAVLLLALATPSLALASQSRSALLASLGRELARIRATKVESVDKAIGIDPVPNVKPLVGASSHEIEKALNAPDNCGPCRLSATCKQPHPGCDAAVGSEWDYDFYKLPPMTVGGGPMLVLKFGPHRRCRSAKWLFMR
jgi:hypothetical protein